MAMSKKITTELLASYAEGNVSKEEKALVRQYLAENPAVMESVAIMMDDDYELRLASAAEDQNKDRSILGRIISSAIQAPSSLCYSAAAFAACEVVSDTDMKKTHDNLQRPCFSECLDDLLNEM